MKFFISTLIFITIIAGGQIVESKQDRKNDESFGLWGACCLPDGTCVMEYATLCYANYEGIFVGGECSENPCPDPIGACCNVSGGSACETYTEFDCESVGGYWQGGATECETSICESEARGACCLPYGGCEPYLTYQECEYEHNDDGMGGFDPNNWSPYTTCEESDCSPTCNPNGFFDNVAYPLTVACQDGPTQYPGTDGATPGYYYCQTWDSTFYLRIKVDLNGDGASETVMGLSCASLDSAMPDKPSKRNGRVILAGDEVGTVQMLDLLDVSPDNMYYENYGNWDGDETFHLVDFLDVTGDSLLDAIVIVQRNDPDTGNYVQVAYYVENISTTEGVACATDINQDNVTDTTDILALIAGWGPCD